MATSSENHAVTQTTTSIGPTEYASPAHRVIYFYKDNIKTPMSVIILSGLMMFGIENYKKRAWAKTAMSGLACLAVGYRLYSTSKIPPKGGTSDVK